MEADGASGKSSEGTKWMYQDPQSSGPSTEDYLLGVRYKDDKSHDEVKELENNRGTLPGSTFLKNPWRNEQAAFRNEAIAIKREDPLFSMRDKEKQVRGQVLENPLQMKRMKKFFIERAKELKGQKKLEQKEAKRDKRKHRHKHKHGRKRDRERKNSQESCSSRSKRQRRGSRSRDPNTSRSRQSASSSNERHRSGGDRRSSTHRKDYGSAHRRERNASKSPESTEHRRGRHRHSSGSRKSTQRNERSSSRRRSTSRRHHSEHGRSASSERISNNCRKSRSRSKRKARASRSRSHSRSSEVSNANKESKGDRSVSDANNQGNNSHQDAQGRARSSSSGSASNSPDDSSSVRRYGLIQPKRVGQTTPKNNQQSRNLGPNPEMVESRMKVMKQEARKNLGLDTQASTLGSRKELSNLSQEEKLKRLSEMSATAHQISQDRNYKAARMDTEEKEQNSAPKSNTFLSDFQNEVASTGDVDSRIRGRRHYIQRDASASNFMSR